MLHYSDIVQLCECVILFVQRWFVCWLIFILCFFFCHKTEQRKRANLTAILVHQFLLRFSENCNYEESSCTNH